MSIKFLTMYYLVSFNNINIVLRDKLMKPKKNYDIRTLFKLKS